MQAAAVLTCEALIQRIERQTGHYLGQPEVRVGLDLAMEEAKALAVDLDAGRLPPTWRVVLGLDPEVAPDPDPGVDSPGSGDPQA
jgi:hypothetical protein